MKESKGLGSNSEGYPPKDITSPKVDRNTADMKGRGGVGPTNGGGAAPDNRSQFTKQSPMVK